MRRTLAALTLVVGLVVAPAAAAEAQVHTAKSFANCTALNKTYPGGVAKNAKVRNTKTVGGKKVAAKSSYKPKVSASLYAANKSKDRDKDGIACER